MARKRFGQHFLHDADVLERIVRAVAPTHDDVIAEIGPGEGALTRLLLPEVKRLHVVELDRDLAATLAGRLDRPDNLEIHTADALKFDFRALAPNGGLRVVGNLPYNISSPLLFHLLDQRGVIRDMHFMLQREVVDRMGAAPNSRTYGRLSVMLQAYCEVTPLFRVSPGAFRPPPAVESAVVRLVPRAESVVPPALERAFAVTVREARANPNRKRGRDAAAAQPGLMLPADRASETPPTVLVAPNTFREGDVVEVDLEDRTLRARLAPSREHSVAYARFPLEKATPRGRSDR